MQVALVTTAAAAVADGSLAGIAVVAFLFVDSRTALAAAGTGSFPVAKGCVRTVGVVVVQDRIDQHERIEQAAVADRYFDGCLSVSQADLVVPYVRVCIRMAVCSAVWRHRDGSNGSSACLR